MLGLKEGKVTAPSPFPVPPCPALLALENRRQEMLGIRTPLKPLKQGWTITSPGMIPVSHLVSVEYPCLQLPSR